MSRPDPTELRVDRARLLRDIEDLAKIGALPAGGIHRKAFSSAYETAVAWLREAMTAAGLAVRRDAAGSLIGRLGPAQGPAVLAGSHIDTVPGGGPLDGALGVLGALEAARCLAAAATPLERAFEVVAFVDEEGAYLGLMGSRAMIGAIPAAEIGQGRDSQGGPLDAAMAQAGLSAGRIPEAARPPGDIAAYLELHIEQGPVLEDEDLPIGIVEGIVGIMMSEYRFLGRADHAGTTPMTTRRDALRGAAQFMTEAYRQVLPGLGDRGRMTFGALDLKPNAANVVPAEVRLRQDMRHLAMAPLREAGSRCDALAREIAKTHGLALEIERHGAEEPAAMDPQVRGAIADACRALGLAYRTMPSGAGHDAQIIAKVAPAGMIFVPSRGGASHRADEWTAPDHLQNGANVLLQSLARLLTRATPG